MLFRPSEKKIGVLGAGQLGKMLITETAHLDIELSFYDSDPNAPAAKHSRKFFCGDLMDKESVFDFGMDHDIITIEIEHVSVEALELLEQSGKQVYPQSHVLKMIQDKGLQKSFLDEHKIPTAPFFLCEDLKDILLLIEANKMNFPFVQKTRKGGYDGKGVQIIHNEQELNKLWDLPSVIERKADIEVEIAVIIARSVSGEIAVYPPVSMDFHPEANLVEWVVYPAEISEEIKERSLELAKQCAQRLNHVGLLAIEMFVNRDGSIWINEMAPRPHNSGHVSLNNGAVSQFENHIRAILDLPLGNAIGNLETIMINVLGEAGHEGIAVYNNLNQLLSDSHVHPFLYGKEKTKPYRKMGHINITGDHIKDIKSKAKWIKQTLQVISSKLG
ncbi:MAG TPA: 5-(carboxyamino)imidazole ribonucleotide synthase [Saprospiraceae bacterium]|nr:5-(carboxyamino)imidazole ribonucleotide synthase [Saprospiraceae bacterium]